MHTATQPVKFSVRLRRDVFYRECRRADLTTDAAIARAFGLDRATIGRIASGQQAATGCFIAAALMTLRHPRFDDLFEM